MLLKVIKVGRGLGVIIPDVELERLGLSVGDEVDVTFAKPGGSQKENRK